MNEREREKNQNTARLWKQFNLLSNIIFFYVWKQRNNPFKAMLQIRKVYFARKIDFGKERSGKKRERKGEKKFYNFSQSFFDTAGENALKYWKRLCFQAAFPPNKAKTKAFRIVKFLLCFWINKLFVRIIKYAEMKIEIWYYIVFIPRKFENLLFGEIQCASKLYAFINFVCVLVGGW